MLYTEKEQNVIRKMVVASYLELEQLCSERRIVRNPLLNYFEVDPESGSYRFKSSDLEARFKEEFPDKRVGALPDRDSETVALMKYVVALKVATNEILE